MKQVMIPDRWEQIIVLVEQRGGVTVEEIADAIGVSPATVRRDLARIHQRGLIKRTRGGAAPSEMGRIGPTLAESRLLNPAQKELIGRVAAELVDNNEVLLIDGGFTTYQVARNLVAKELVVATNSLDVAQALAGRSNIRLVILGGELSAATGTTLGPATEQQVLTLSADKAILGVDAFSCEEGLTSPNAATAQTKQAMIACARELILVADHSKLGRSALYRIAPAQRVTTLVTDDQADPAFLEAIRALGIEVIVASA
jgi:DeoR/GlpR family transcriptional regulator of sugar metabolism